jgi:hypothetical protein
MIYVLHDSQDSPIVTGQPYWRNQRKQPKAYTSERNARIAVGNKSGNEVIVPYVAINDPTLISYIAQSIASELRPMEEVHATEYVANLLAEFVKAGEVSAEKKGRDKS